MNLCLGADRLAPPSGMACSSLLACAVRVREHITSTLRGHEQEVCGLKWAPWSSQLASGATTTCSTSGHARLLLPLLRHGLWQLPGEHNDAQRTQRFQGSWLKIQKP